MRFLILLFILFSCSLIQHQNTNDYFERLKNISILKSENILQTIKENNQGLYRQIISDSKDSNLINIWGESLNFDSSAKKKILEDQMIQNLQESFGLKNDYYVVHAGVTHTYGYLFSTINTPYGYKRQRWISPSIANGFNLSKFILSPATEDGTLLSNITYFAGKIAFEDKTMFDALVNVALEIKNYNYEQLKLTVIREKFNSDFEVKTTLVPYLTIDSSDTNRYLLIYTILNIQTKLEKLITAFPINEKSFKELINPAGLGDNKELVLKYNATAKWYDGKPLLGSRKIYTSL